MKNQTHSPSSDFRFIIDGGKAKIIGYVGSDSHVVIPSDLGGSPVAVISAHSFTSETIEHVVLPETLEKLENPSFFRCPVLKTIHFSSGVSSAHASFAIECPSLENIDVSEDNPYFRSVGGVLYSKDMTRLVRCPVSVEGEFAVPDGVRKIDSEAFLSCLKITKLIYPSCTEKIAFEVVGTAKDHAALSALEVSEDHPLYSTVDGILYNKDKTQLLRCPVGRKDDVTVPDGVLSIDSCAFLFCSEIRRIHLPDSAASLGSSAFAHCSSLEEINIPHGVTTLESTFSQCSSLERITVPDSVLSLGSFCFSECTSLRELFIPSSVLSVGSCAFQGCTSLADIAVDEANTALSAEDGILFDKNRTEILFVSPLKKGLLTIPAGVRSIDRYALSCCSEITEIAIPASLAAIHRFLFIDCTSLRGFTVDKESEYYAACDGMLTDKSMTALIRCPQCKAGSVILPDSVKKLSSNAFSSCRLITEVELPVGISAVPTQAFYRCTALESVTLPETVIALGSFAFWGCKNLCTLELPESLRTIGDLAFTGCNVLITAPHNPSHYGYTPDVGVSWTLTSI